MTLDVCKDKFIATALVNKVSKCRQCLSKFVGATWIDQSTTKLQTAFVRRGSTSQTAVSSSKDAREDAGDSLPISQIRKPLEKIMSKSNSVSHQKGTQNKLVLLDENSMPLSFVRVLNLARNHSALFK